MVDGDLATSELYLEGNREPLWGFEEEKGQPRVLETSLLLYCGCGVGGDKPRERGALGRG